MNRREIKEVVNQVLSQGFQLRPEALLILEDIQDTIDVSKVLNQVINFKLHLDENDFLITDKDFTRFLPLSDVHLERDGERSQVPVKRVNPEFEVLQDPTENISPLNASEGFQTLFTSRYKKLLRVLMQRPDSHQIQKISSLDKGRPNTIFKVAGLVSNREMRRKQIELTIDDDTDSITVLGLNDEIRKSVSGVLTDQMVVVDLVFSKRGTPIAKSIYPPDIPDRKANMSKEEVYALLLSDIHVGSKYFLQGAFDKMVKWVSDRSDGTSIASKVMYIVMAGDLVDGIGVYPGQNNELEIKSVVEQYGVLAKLLRQFPKEVRIIIVPGDHDSTRKALPQPAVPIKHGAALYEIENVSVLGNPSFVSLHGVHILVYHGRSLYDVIASTPGLSVSDPTSAMKVLLRGRHLAPMYGSRSPLSPEPEDTLVIEQVPDVFHTGHLHTIGGEYYRGTLMVNSGCWQAQTKFQENVGITPIPAVVPIINLATLDIQFKDFRLQ